MSEHQWQPISTAPKATMLLLWWRPKDGNPHAESVTIGSIPSEAFASVDDEQKGKYWSACGGMYQDIWHITHWMPLPERPESV